MNHKLPNDGADLPYLLAQRSKNHTLPTDRDNNGSDNAGVGHADLKWCTMSCPHANWPRDNVDGSRSCRTFNAVWCDLLRQHVTRNTPCSAEHGARRPKPNW
ncbi:hypothetical protein GF324_11785 [bacterium]|nr:hypothetical protein [bacterium]